MGRIDGCLAYLKVFPSVTAPREFHPPASLPGPTHCLRRFERSDCGCKGVPILLRVVAHALPNAFYSGVVIARSIIGSPGAPAVRLGTEGMYLSALYCAGIIRRAFFVKSLVPGRGKGEHAPGVALHRQYLKAGHNAVQ